MKNLIIFYSVLALPLYGMQQRPSTAFIKTRSDKNVLKSSITDPTKGNVLHKAVKQPKTVSQQDPISPPLPKPKQTLKSSEDSTSDDGHHPLAVQSKQSSITSSQQSIQQKKPNLLPTVPSSAPTTSSLKANSPRYFFCCLLRK